MITDRQQARWAVLDNRVERVEAHLAELRRVESRYPWIRLAIFLAGVTGCIYAFTSLPGRWAGWLALVVFISVFSTAAYFHRRVFASLNRFEILRRLSLEQRARARLDWSGIPPAPGFVAEKNHPFELDLDLTGEHSLFQLLDTAASTGGSARLRGWLLKRRPDLAETARRQDLVRELIPLAGFRERLAVASALVLQNKEQRWDGERLLKWLSGGALPRSFLPLLVLLAVLSIANLVLFYLNVTGVLPAYWLGGVALFWALQGLNYRETSELFSDASYLSRSLDQFRAVLFELETYQYTPGSRLEEVCRPFLRSGRRPSQSLRQVSWIVSAVSLRSNPFLGLFLNTVLPWDMFFTFLLDRAKKRVRGQLPEWLDAWYELEALSSLANFAVINPDNTFPIIIAPEKLAERPVFEARAIGHPLLPAAARVNNDFLIQKTGELFIITGSNMSGKSTFLRTLGVNLCLAYAGATVCAEQLTTLPFRLFTSIQLSDSLDNGISYFYAEVRRLRALLDALQLPDELPLFFLIDEIFRGTNNRERQTGSLAYTQTLAGKNGTGCISTHDLELAHLSEIVPGIRNVHFREDVRGGRMVFDFKLRPGPSPTTNALRIMELEGLPVHPRGLPEKDS